jgi:hypothetical protein
MASGARKQEKQTAGKTGSGRIKGTGSAQGSTTGPVEIKNAVAMCGVKKGQGYAKIKGTVSG